ncbi:MAG: hypothetical protein CL799_09425 [Chromatiales bacterium]|jgi:general secretion pathway protein K|nr:hypothetical protein [Chromatiales bacterium]MDP6151468.1 type II secretion system minor pseudopilin GspK [Gammaproteobacteria bacterium]HJP03801.1 type II secretion system minor pseudopilin GspK [Gammaproteobacteria bacterium]
MQRKHLSTVPKQRQSGVALVTAILLVALATAIAAKLSWDSRVSMRRTETLLAQEQARLFALGAEAVAIEVLLDDGNPNADYYVEEDAEEEWATPPDSPFNQPVTIGIEDLVLGQMQGWLQDAHSRLNLNNLVSPASSGQGPDQNAIDQFDRLFNDLQLDRRILDNIIDWIDNDTVPYRSGAEDGAYTSLEVPFRPANDYFVSASELRSVRDVDEEVYDTLRDYVTALPPGWCGTGLGTTSVTAVNLNFASAPVIQALGPSITESQAEVWVEEAQNTGFKDLGEVSGLPPDVQQGGYAAVNSSCFELRVLVGIGSSVLSMYSLLDRSASNDVITRIRSFGIE